MQSGKLRKKSTVQRREIPEQFDAHGQRIESWKNLGVVYVDIRDLRGTELLRAQSLDSQVTSMIMMRDVIDIKPQDRIVTSSSIYNIISVIRRDRRQRRIEVNAVEQING